VFRCALIAAATVLAGLLLPTCAASEGPDPGAARTATAPLAGDESAHSAEDGVPERQQTGTRVYQVVIDALPVGEYVLAWEPEDDAWRVRATHDVMAGSMAAGMLHQVETLRVRAEDLAPISSRHSWVQGALTVDVELRSVDGRLSGRVRLPEALGSEQPLTAELPEGTMMAGVDELWLETTTLHDGWTATRHVFTALPDRQELLIAAAELRRASFEERPVEPAKLNLSIGTIAAVRYHVAGTHSVTVPAGTFSAYRVEVTGLAEPQTISLRREAPHVVLRRELPARFTVIELTGTQPN
jgi:hypothetical protein